MNTVFQISNTHLIVIFLYLLLVNIVADLVPASDTCMYVCMYVRLYVDSLTCILHKSSGLTRKESLRFSSISVALHSFCCPCLQLGIKHAYIHTCICKLILVIDRPMNVYCVYIRSYIQLSLCVCVCVCVCVCTRDGGLHGCVVL